MKANHKSIIRDWWVYDNHESQWILIPAYTEEMVCQILIRKLISKYKGNIEISRHQIIFNFKGKVIEIQWRKYWNGTFSAPHFDKWFLLTGEEYESTRR